MIRIDTGPPAISSEPRSGMAGNRRPGGYAASTLAGCHTRRYHGLMVANLQAPDGRYCLLSKLEDSLAVGKDEFFFTRHRYPGVLFPPGPSILREFILDICPRFNYRVGGLSLQKSVMLVHGTGTLLVRYDLERSPAGGLLRLKPFLAYRGYHELARENGSIRSRTEGIANGFTIEPYAGMPPLAIRTGLPSRFLPSPAWYRSFEYTEERERGFDWHEDLFLPGVMEVPLVQGSTVILLASCGPSGEEPAALWDAELARRREELARDGKLVDPLLRDEPPEATDDETRIAGPVLNKAPHRGALEAAKKRRQVPGAVRADGFDRGDRELLSALLRAGRQFLIRTPSGRPAVIAGYPWFASWGRDTLISLPGLAFCSGRIGEGIEILTELGRHEREGLLPNFFSGDGKPEAYNTVDSSLLYFWAIQELLRITGDADLIRETFWPVMTRIIRSLMAGTRFAIGMDESGLLHAGDGLTALTWMDATVGGVPVTPRHGYPVEINALWYNALSFTRALAERFADPEWSFGEIIARTQVSVSGDLLDSRRRISGRRLPRRHPRHRRPAESALRRLAPLLAPRPPRAGGRCPEGPGGAPHPLWSSDSVARGPGLPVPLPGQRRRAGLCVPSGHRLALAARSLRRGRPEGSPRPQRRKGGTPQVSPHLSSEPSLRGGRRQRVRGLRRGRPPPAGRLHRPSLERRGADSPLHAPAGLKGFRNDFFLTVRIPPKGVYIRS